MKYLPVILAVAVAAIVNVADAKIDLEKKAEIIKQCQEESKASDSDVELAKKHEIPESKEGKCFISCGFKKYGLLKDGKMNLEGVNKFFEEAFDDQEKRDKAIKTAAACVASEDVKGIDDCEASVKYLQCVKKDPEYANLMNELVI